MMVVWLANMGDIDVLMDNVDRAFEGTSIC